jgi:threonine dehydratase
VFQDVVAAAARIDGHAHRTPVMTSRTANHEIGAEVFSSAKTMRCRASNSAAPARRTSSSGNHAQAIALSARLLGIPATIVMPHDAPAAKVAATRGYGGSIVSYDRYMEDRDLTSSIKSPPTGR